MELRHQLKYISEVKLPRISNVKLYENFLIYTYRKYPNRLILIQTERKLIPIMYSLQLNKNKNTQNSLGTYIISMGKIDIYTVQKGSTDHTGARVSMDDLTS